MPMCLLVWLAIDWPDFNSLHHSVILSLIYAGYTMHNGFRLIKQERQHPRLLPARQDRRVCPEDLRSARLGDVAMPSEQGTLPAPVSKAIRSTKLARELKYSLFVPRNQ